MLVASRANSTKISTNLSRKTYVCYYESTLENIGKKLALLTLTVQCNWMVNQKLDGLHVTLTYGDTITLLKMNEWYVCRN